MKKYFSFTLLILILSEIGYSQDTLTKNYFRSPLDIPLYLAGDFGELRTNHFHTGVDIKTQGREGFNVYAVADGFVSRISISPWGYGNVIYIDHPNGYTSVYAHLKSFKGKIAEEIFKHQHELESWEIDWYPPDTLLKVKKGDLIALTGNTGGSRAPHMHFELRETKSEFATNPLLHCFNIKDNIAPVINGLEIIPLDNNSFVNNKNESLRFRIVGKNGNYHLKYDVPLKAYGKIGFAISGFDRLNEMPNQNAIYSIALYKNDTLIYKSIMKKIDFEQLKAINALIDYPTFIKTGKRYQRSYILPNNQLNVYDRSIGNGIVSLNQNEKAKLKYIVKDSYGNQSELSFEVVGFKDNNVMPGKINKPDAIFNYNDSNYFETTNVKVEIPKDALYENFNFNFSVGDTITNTITPIYHISDELTPILKPISIAIKVARLSDSLREKVVIVSIDNRKRFYAQGGEWKNNFLTTKVKFFGDFTVMIDTVPPKVSPFNIYPNKNMGKNTEIMVKIADNLSGIKKYRATIDGKWVIMAYEAKKAILFYTFRNLPKGNHLFKIEVSDAVGNSTTTEIPFIR